MSRIVVLSSFAESLVNLRGHLLGEMVKNGHQVFACAPGDSPVVSKQLKELGVEYLPAGLSRTGLNPLVDLVSIIRLVRLFKSIRADVFLGYAIKPVIYGSIAAKLTGAKRIYSMIPGVGYAFSGRDRKSRIVGRLAQYMYRFALRFNDLVFFQNPDDQQLFLNLNLIKDPGKACLINGSGVDTRHFLPQPFPSTITYLLTARLIKDKGIGEFVEAARIVRDRYSSARFKLVGFFEDTPSSVSKERLDAWIHEGVIEYLGPLDDVRPALADCSVFVLPSYYREGTPRVILEAMAVGRPIITTDSPGCRETVVHQVNGYLIPTRDVPALVAAMESFIVDPGALDKMGAASREIAVEKYDVRKVTASILDGMNLVAFDAPVA